jgi:hypothetical protein
MAFPIQRLRRLRHHEATIQRKVFFYPDNPCSAENYAG